MFVQDDFRARANLTINMGVRYSLFRQPTDANGFMNTFDPAAYNPAKAPQIDANGNLVPGTGDPLNGQVIVNKIANENYRNFGPRLGVSWDPLGDQQTSIRAGYGLVYDTPAPGLWEAPITTNPISALSVTYTNTTFASITSGTIPPPASPPALTAFGTTYKTPYTQHWGIDLQRHLPGRMLLDIGYAGAKSTHLLGEPDINQLQPGQAVALGITPAGTALTTTTDPRVNAYRPYRGYRAINLYETWFNSNYNALQVQFKKELVRGGFVQANYTWSKTLTDAGTNSATPQNFYNRAADRGFSPYDRAQVIGANWDYELPFLRESKSALRYVVGGWEYWGFFP